MDNIVKIGRVELFEHEAREIYEAGKYILTYSKVYAVDYSAAQKRFYGRVVINQGGARRGRYHIMTAKEINHLFGKSILIEA
jgi:hypothetical protein